MPFLEKRRCVLELKGVKTVTYQSGPERYAPPDRRPAEPDARVGQISRGAIAGNVREFVRRDVRSLDRHREMDVAGGQSVENLKTLVRRAAGASMDEIDRVIAELEGVRDMLRNEGDRVSRDIAGYASLGRSATTVLGIIGDSIKQWKDAGTYSPRP
jgi:hypothetical protein